MDVPRPDDDALPPKKAMRSKQASKQARKLLLASTTPQRQSLRQCLSEPAPYSPGECGKVAAAVPDVHACQRGALRDEPRHVLRLGEHATHQPGPRRRRWRRRCAVRAPIIVVVVVVVVVVVTDGGSVRRHRGGTFGPALGVLPPEGPSDARRARPAQAWRTGNQPTNQTTKQPNIQADEK